MVLDSVILLLLDSFSLTFTILCLSTLLGTTYLDDTEQWDVTIAVTVVVCNITYLVWLFYVC